MSIQDVKIPSREEFHRYWGGNITADDFAGYEPTGRMVEQAAHAIAYTKNRCIRREDYCNDHTD